MKRINGGVSISFEYAKWQVEKMEKMLNNVASQGRSEEHMYKVMTGKLQLWKTILEMTCVQHVYEESDSNFGRCKNCGRSHADEGYFDEFQDCYTCEFLEIEGGDLVDYGSTKVSLPVNEICNFEEFENYTEDGLTLAMKIGKESRCPHWKGKII